MKLRRLTSVLLLFAMLLGMAGEAFAANVTWPVDASAGDIEISPFDTPTSSTEALANDDELRHPILRIDFLGDNRNDNTGAIPDPLANQAAVDFEYGADGAWKYGSTSTYMHDGSNIFSSITPYDVQGSGIIFWVGVGIERLNMLKILEKDNLGIFSAELGFYYDPNYVEPYIDPYVIDGDPATDDFYRTIQHWNINNANNPHDWSSDYRVVSASADYGDLFMDDDVANVTQEMLDNPTNGDIKSANWKLMHAVIELDPESTAAAGRFDKVYNVAAANDMDTEYLLLVPFRLKRYDTNEALKFRLARNAQLCSIGAFTKESANSYGYADYAMWERNTGRNNSKNLKVLCDFAGDLNIYKGVPQKDQYWYALLDTSNGGSPQNTVGVYRTGEYDNTYVRETVPLILDSKGSQGPLPGLITTKGQELRNLTEGTQISIAVTLDLSYKVTVTATDFTTTTLIPSLTIVQNTRYYTFVMPNDNVLITVKFDPLPGADYHFHLIENVDLNDDGTVDRYKSGDESKSVYEGTGSTLTAEQGGPIVGNYTKLTKTTGATASLDSNSAPKKHEESGIGYNCLMSPQGETLRLDFTVNGDYYAVVSISRLDNNFITTFTSMTGAVAQDGNNLIVTGNASVEYTTMSSGNDILVTYLPITKYNAKIELIGPPDTSDLSNFPDAVHPLDDHNTAQLHYSGWKLDNTSETRYSAVVKDTNVPGAGNKYLNDVVKSATGILMNIPKSLSIGNNLRRPPLTAAEISYNIAAGNLGAINYLDLYMNDIRWSAAGAMYTQALMSSFTLAVAGLTTFFTTNGFSTTHADGTVYADIDLTQLQLYLLGMTADAIDPAPANRTAALNAVKTSWTYPSGTMSGATSIDVVPGRTATLVIEAEASKEVDKVRVISATTGAAAVGVSVTADPNNANVYTFTMPEEHVVVKVVYRERYLGDVDLLVSKSTLTALDLPGSVDVWGYAPPSTPSNYPDIVSCNDVAPAIPPTVVYDAIRVFDGSVVTFVVEVMDGYNATATVTTLSGLPISTSSSTQTLTDKKLVTYTFNMPIVALDGDPAGDVRINVEFTKLPGTLYEATILTTNHPDYTGIDPGFITKWTIPTPVFGNQTVVEATQGTALTATVDVVAGFYIRAVVAYTATTSYPVTVSGSGWNNGEGAGAGSSGVHPPVAITTQMPNEDYYVVVYYDAGPPVPDYTLLLQVIDILETDSSAQILTVGGLPDSGAPLVTMLNNNPYQRYAQPGDVVTLEVLPDTGMYIKSVSVMPASLGVTVVPTSATTFKFIMPADYAAVVVEFTDTAPKHSLSVYKQELGTNTSALNEVIDLTTPLVTLDNATPASIAYGDTVANAANFFDPVTINVDVDTNWRIADAYLVSGGSVYPVTLSGDGWIDGATTAQVQITFNMPLGDARLYVVYSQDPPPDPDEHRLRLTVYDPHNAGGTADNWAAIALNSNTVATPDIGKLGMSPTYSSVTTGMTIATTDDLVTIYFAADTAYSVEAVLVTANGGTIFPTYTSTGSATFIMPDADTTVVVRFTNTAPRQYRAELIPIGHDSKPDNIVSFDAFPTIQHIEYAQAGATLTANIKAADGYYIKDVYILPTALGVPIALSGSFGLQSLSFAMPAADVYVYVIYEALWPDETGFKMNLVVHDPSRTYDTYGNFAEGTSGAASTAEVPGGDSDFIYVQDGELVRIKMTAASGHYVESIKITKKNGASVSYYYSAAGEITFAMPASETTVTVRFAEGTAPDYDITLYIVGGTYEGATALTNNVSTAFITANGATLTPNYPGDDIVIDAAPAASAHIAAIYAVDQYNNVVYISYGTPPTPPTSTPPHAGKSSFAMPAADVVVYVVYEDGTIPSNSYRAVLNVSGPTGSGKAELSELLDPTNTTGEVTAVGSDTIFATLNTRMTVSVAAEADYALSSISVLDYSGNPVAFVWTSPTTIEFAMPLYGASVFVRYVDTSGLGPFRAQLVVNDSENSTGTPNTAKLINNDASGFGTWVDAFLITDLDAGDWVEVDVKMLANFMVESIIVVSQSYGIAPVVIDPYHDFTTGFFMPADDVVVYVKFADDKLTRYNVTLRVTPNATFGANAPNQASIKSEVTPWQGPIMTGTKIVSAASTPGKAVEIVEVKYTAESGYYAVVTVVSGGVGIPFVQVDATHITFPMVPAAVEVHVEYVSIADAPKYKLTVHTVDEGGAGYARGWFNDLSGTVQTTGWAQTSATMNTVTADVHGGAVVNIDSFVDNVNSFIKAAYVVYNGYMIEMNFVNFDGDYTGAHPSGTGEPTPPSGGVFSSFGDFIMHPAVTDVFVVFGDKAEQPTPDEYAAVLSLFSESTDTESYATITRADGTTSDRADVSHPPDYDYAYVTADAGEILSVVINPKAGYEVDTFEVSPLLGSVTVVQVDTNEYRVIMPAGTNIAIRVTLRPASGAHTVTLHLSPTGPAPGGSPYNYEFGQTNLTRAMPTGDVVINTDGASMPAPEGAELVLDVWLDSGWYIKHAYAMQGTKMIQLEKVGAAAAEPIALENKVAVGTPDSIDASAKFRMPNGDVDVYLVFEYGTPPAGNWRTLVVVADDTNHSGSNDVHVRSYDGALGGPAGSINTTSPSAPIPSDGLKIYAYPIKTSETVNVWVNNVNTSGGYQFAPPPGFSPASFVPNMSLGPLVYNYDFPMTPNNLAVTMLFETADITAYTLTVELIDPQNPTNGTVVNSANVAVDGISPTLTLNSSTSAGAAHSIANVPGSSDISITVTPQPGYLARAVITDGTTKPIELTRSGATYTGVTTMPSADAVISIYYVRGLEAKLLVTDMTSNLGTSIVGTFAAGTAIKDASAGVTGTTYTTSGTEYNHHAYTVVGLQDGDINKLQITPAAGSVVVSVTYTTSLGTYAAEYNVGEGYYAILMPDENITINVLVDSSTGDTHHTAFGRVEDNLGNSQNAVTEVRNLTNATLPRGAYWTNAVGTDAVAVYFTAAPSCYPEVDVNVLNTMGQTLAAFNVVPTVVFDSVTGQGVVYVTMPDDSVTYANLEVVVSFTTTAPPATPHNLTLEVVGHGSNSSNTSQVAVNSSVRILSAGATVLPLVGVTANYGDAIGITASATAGYRVTKITLTVGGVEYTLSQNSLTAAFAMPNDDAKITVYFSDKYDATLVISGDIGGSAADMTTDGTPPTVNVSSGATSGTATGVSTGSTVTLNVTTESNKHYQILQNTSAGTVVIEPMIAGTGSPLTYTPIINDDTTYTVVVISNDGGGTPTTYVASVELEGDHAPLGNSATITAVPTATPMNGDIWTAAKPLDVVTVFVNVEPGYRAIVSGGTLAAPVLLSANGSVSGIMPANSIVYTVEYLTDAEYVLTLFVDDSSNEPDSMVDVEVNATSQISHTSSGNESGVVGYHIPIASADTVKTDVVTPSADTSLLSLLYENASGSYPITINGANPSYDGTFTVPTNADTQVTAVIGETPDDPDDTLFTVTVSTTGDAGYLAEPQNHVLDTDNVTTTGLPDGILWTMGLKGDYVRVNYTVASGWYAVVTATDAASGAVSVATLALTNSSAAFVQIPTPTGSDVNVNIHYTTTPPTTPHTLTLDRVGHEDATGNRAAVGPAPSGTPSFAAVDGSASAATATQTAGEQILLTATKASSDYVIYKVTITVGAVEVELPMNEYAGVVSVVFVMPDDDADVKVYYALNYKATLKWVSLATPTDASTSKMTEDAHLVNNSVTVDSAAPIKTLTDLPVGTQLDVVTAPAANVEVAAVLLTATGGSTSYLTEGDPNKYAHTMISADKDVTITTIYKDYTDTTNYIAAVKTIPTAPATGNSVGISTTPANAVSGIIWTAADGDAGELVTVSINVASGTYAKISAVKVSDGSAVTLSTTVLNVSGVVTFNMPEDNVLVTVEFVSGKLTATLLIDDKTVVGTTAVQSKVQAGDPNHVSQLVQAAAPSNEVDTHLAILPGLGAGERVIVYADPITNDEYEDMSQDMHDAIEAEYKSKYTPDAVFEKTTVASVVATWSQGSFPVPMVHRGSGGTDGALESNPAVGAGYPSGTVGAFAMPNENVYIRVVYDEIGDDGDDDEVSPAEQEVFIVTASKTGDAAALSAVGNALDDVSNTTTAGLSKGNAAYGEFWAEGIGNDRVLINFTTAATYYAEVTAYKVVDGVVTAISVPVLQLDTTGSSTTPGRAYVQIVDSSIHVYVEYTTTPPTAGDLELYITGHTAIEMYSGSAKIDGNNFNTAQLTRVNATPPDDELILRGDMANTSAGGYTAITTPPEPAWTNVVATTINDDLRYEFLDESNITFGDGIDVDVGFGTLYRIAAVRLVPTSALPPATQLGVVTTVPLDQADAEAAALAVGPYVEIPMSAGATGGTISGSFTMPVGDITAIVIFTDPGYALRPHDPTNEEDTSAGLNEGYIEAVNNNDYENLIVVVPTLADGDDKLHDTYEVASPTPADEKKGRYRFYYYDTATSSYVELTQKDDDGVTSPDFEILPYNATDVDTLPTVWDTAVTSAPDGTDAGITPPYVDHAYNFSNDETKIPERYQSFKDDDGNPSTPEVPDVEYTASKYRMVAISTLAKDIVEKGALLYITYTPYREDTSTSGTFEWYEPESVRVQFVVPPMEAPRPYDPEDAEITITAQEFSDAANAAGGTTTPADFEDNTLLEIGWIYGDNHGEYATITVPTLFETRVEWDKDGAPTDGEFLYDVYVAPTTGSTPTPAKYETFEIYYTTDDVEFVLLPQTTTTTTPTGGGAPVTVNALITLRPETDEDTPTGYPYNVGNYYSDTTPYDYTGAMFDLVPVHYDNPMTDLSTDEQALYAAIRAILDNDGSYDLTKTVATHLYIKGITDDGRESALVPLVIPPYLALGGTLLSYAPNHEATVYLYEETATTGVYETEPSVMYKLPVIANDDMTGYGMYQQQFMVKSSKLAGRTAMDVENDYREIYGIDDVGDNLYNQTYKMEITKASAITYTRTGIELDTTPVTPTPPITEWWFMRAMGSGATPPTPKRDIIPLITGDINGDGSANALDLTYIQRFIDADLTYTTDADSTGATWATSIYNPKTIAYRADLNGNGRIDADDMSILMNSNNFNRGKGVYANPTKLELPYSPRSAVVESLVGNLVKIAPMSMSFGFTVFGFDVEADEEMEHQELLDVYEDEQGNEVAVDLNAPQTELTDEQEPPTDEQEPPTDEEDPPTDEQEPPTDEEDPPTDEEEPPTDEQDPPTDEQEPPTDEEDPPTDEQEETPIELEPPDVPIVIVLPSTLPDDPQFFPVDIKRKKS